MHPHLSRLVRDGTLTSHQRELLRQGWSDSSSDLWAEPSLRDVREHTRAYIDQLRRQDVATALSKEQEGGEVHG